MNAYQQQTPTANWTDWTSAWQSSRASALTPAHTLGQNLRPADPWFAFHGGEESGNWGSRLQGTPPDFSGYGVETVEVPGRWAEPRQSTAIFEGLEKQMAEFAAEHVAGLNDLRKHFVLPADLSVLNFLSGHRIIPQMLLQAAPHLRNYFGARAVFNLRAPIDESGSQTLYAVVMWPGNVRDVRQALARFDDAWWIANSRRASGYLAFTYELV